MIIMGIDPGIAIVGVGVIEHTANKFKTIYYDAVTTPAHTPIEQRIKTVYEDIAALIEKFRPDAMAIEELFFNNNAKTAFAVGQARGVIVLAAALSNTSVYSYTPLQVKQAVTGYGRADKNQVQQMTKAMLGLPAIPKPDDVADALAIAICHAHSFRMNAAFDFAQIVGRE